MARKGRSFELAYKKLYDMLDKNIYTISSPGFPVDKTTGKGREVDVLIEYMDPQGRPRRISIECRDRSAVQDVMWIEQLVQKKEDLDLDYTIATTTSAFTDGAIAKAKYHGIHIEQAEMPTKETIDKLRNTAFVDFFFFKFNLIEFQLFFMPKGYIALKEFLNKLNIMERSAILNLINTEFLWSFEPREIIEKHTDAADYFSSEGNCLEMEGTSVLDKEQSATWKGAKAIKYKIEVVPRKLSLPIKNYFSAFNVQDRLDIKYHADFQNDTDYISVGYINGKLVVHLGLKKRRFWRITGSTMKLNIALPEDRGFDKEALMDAIIENHLGEFDLAKVLQ